MLKKSKYILIFIAFFISFFVDQHLVVANTAYKTFTEDGYGNYVETQSAYTVRDTIVKFDDETFKQASDLKMSEEGLLYVSDTGNQRILVGDTKGNLVQIIGEDVLQKPNGIYLSEDKLYVADEVEAKVFVFSKDGELLDSFGKPDSILFGETSSFVPEKVAVDSRQNMYIISRGNSNGIIQINANNGDFIGYFSPNQTVVSPLTIFRKAIFTDEQLSKMIDIIPPTAKNLNLDGKGLVYTVSQGDGADPIKKLNMAGKNIIDVESTDSFPVSVDIGALENIFVASEGGFIYEYTSEGNLLFVFGGQDDGRQRVGLFSKISAITLDERNYIYALDPEKGQIQVFQPTEFADLVHTALTLYQNGDYEKSKEPWNEVIRLNSLFDFANLGLGEAHFKDENYEAALTSFTLAKYKSGYSDSFWEIRNKWLQNNIIYILLLIVILVLAKKALEIIERKYQYWHNFKRKINRKYKLKLLKDITFVKNLLRHPIDSFYSIKYENKTSPLSATILMGIFFIIFIANKYYSGFIFKTVEEGRFSIGSDIAIVFSAFLLIIISNYLICTINDGEGKFKHMYSGFIYSLAPYFIFKPFIVIASNVLTFNEAYLLSLANFIIYAWVGILLIVMIMEINDYTIRETIKIILLTLFTLLIAVLLIFIVYVLVSQLISFVISIFNEGVYRIENG